MAIFSGEVTIKVRFKDIQVAVGYGMTSATWMSLNLTLIVTSPEKIAIIVFLIKRHLWPRWIWFLDCFRRASRILNHRVSRRSVGTLNAFLIQYKGKEIITNPRTYWINKAKFTLTSLVACFILGKVYFEPIWAYWRGYACGLKETPLKLIRGAIKIG